jgi:hypothetical protein
LPRPTATTTTARTAVRSGRVVNASRSQYQISSVWWPPIITAPRSFPETATDRAPGNAAFMRSPSVGTFSVSVVTW